MKRWWVAAACAVVGVFAVATASLAQADDPPDVAPEWLHKPTSDDLLAVWPMEALAKSLEGEAVIRCKISLQGSLFGCTVISEQPTGSGFGGAAIALTTQFAMTPAKRNGQPVVTEVTIPIKFQMPRARTGSYLPPGAIKMPTALMDKVFSDVPWLAAPTFDDVVAAYPKRAAKKGVSGRVALNCRFAGDGAIKGCRVIDEQPMGMGFGQAAQSLGKRFKGPTVGGDGKPINGAFAHVLVAFTPEILDPSRQFIGKPAWAALPDSDAFRASYPAGAAQAGVGQARVVMSCTVGAGGGLEGCAVDSEEPPAMGFGAATLGLSGDFRLLPWSADGLPVIGAVVRVPVRYAIGRSNDPN